MCDLYVMIFSMPCSRMFLGVVLEESRVFWYQLCFVYSGNFRLCFPF